MVKQYHEQFSSKKYVQCDSIIFPKTFFFKALSNFLDLCLAYSRILYF